MLIFSASSFSLTSLKIKTSSIKNVEENYYVIPEIFNDGFKSNICNQDTLLLFFLIIWLYGFATFSNAWHIFHLKLNFQSTHSQIHLWEWGKTKMELFNEQVVKRFN